MRIPPLLIGAVVSFALFADAGGWPPARILARVTSVENNVILLDKGSSHGVEPGMLFDIYREAKVVFIPMTKERVLVEERQVAQVIVTKAAPSCATCELVKLIPDAQVAAGDSAVRTNPLLAPAVNAPPVIESLEVAPGEPYAGEEVVVKCKVSDVNDDFHIFSWTCDAGQFSAGETVTGEVRWLCPVKERQAAITVTVTDPHGARATLTRRVNSPGMAQRGKSWRPTASFGQVFPRFLKIAFAAFDPENRLVILDSLEKKLVTLSEDFNILRLSAAYGEESSFTLVKMAGQHLYAADAKAGCVSRYRYEGDIFRRKPEVVYGSRGSGNGCFTKVADLEVGPGGYVYVLDSATCTIHVFSQDGTFACSFGKTGDKPGEMRLPTSLSMDCEGNLYVSDYARRRILKFNSDNRFVAEFDLAGKLGTPLALRYSRRHDTLVVLEGMPHAVRVLSTSGQLIRTFPDCPNPMGALIEPEQLAVSLTGEVLVVCQKGEALRRYRDTGEFLGKLGAEDLGAVSSFAVTPQGDVYLMDAAKGHVWYVDRDGWIKARFAGRGPNPGQLQSPTAICCDTDGNAYILDRTQKNILKFSPDGKLLASIGKPGSGKEEIAEPIDLYGAGDKIYLLQYRDRWSVHAYTPEGKLLILFPDKDNETSSPCQIAVDGAGSSYLLAWGGLECFNRDGAKQAEAVRLTLRLSDLALDARGDIFGTCPGSGELLRIDRAHQAVQWRLASTQAAPNCEKIAFDSFGRMYVLDKYTRAVVRLTEVVRK